MDQITTLGHFIIVLGIELALDGIVVLLGPGAEGPLQPIFLPVDQYFLHRSFLLVRLSRVLKPRVEATADLHLRHPAHVVRQDFLGEIFRLGNDGNFTGLDSFDLFSLVFNGQGLTFDVSRHVICFLHVGHLHLCGLDILPLLEGSTNGVSHDAIHGAVHELPRKFELSHVLFPSGDTVLQVGITASQFKPIAPGCDVRTTSRCLSLRA